MPVDLETRTYILNLLKKFNPQTSGGISSDIVPENASKDNKLVVNSDLADVAKTGDYNDLINKPTIPSTDYVDEKIEEHNTDIDAHYDIRQEIQEIDDKLVDYVTQTDVADSVSTHDTDTTSHADMRQSIQNIAGDVSDIQTVIPEQASVINPLTTQSYVDDAISNLDASYISSSESMVTQFEHCTHVGDTASNLEDGPWFKDGVECGVETGKYVTKNNYAIVSQDESVCYSVIFGFRYQRKKDGGATPFSYVELPDEQHSHAIINAITEGPLTGALYFVDNTKIFNEHDLYFVITSLSVLTNAVTIFEDAIGGNIVGRYDLFMPTTRYSCSASQTATSKPVWAFQYIVNDTPFTGAQLEALNSGVTKEILDNKANRNEIPIVNDGKLTIEYNGQTACEFTANSAEDKTLNIIVPSNVTDLDDYDNYLNKTNTGINILNGGIQIGTFTTDANDGYTHVRVHDSNIVGTQLKVDENGNTLLQNKTYDDTLGTGEKNISVLRLNEDGLQVAKNIGDGQSPAENMYENVLVDSDLTSHNIDTTAHNDIREDIADIESSLLSYATKSDISSHNIDTTAHNDIREDITDIENLIPNQATVDNQLADKEFVNSSITTNTATFRGTNQSAVDKRGFYDWVNQLEGTNNDYVFWRRVDENGNVTFDRFKYVPEEQDIPMGGLLPEGYTRVEYIGNPNGNVNAGNINLNFIPNNNTVSFLDYYSENQLPIAFYGYYDGNDAKDYRFFIGYFDIFGGRLSGITSATVGRHTLELGNFYIKENGLLIQSGPTQNIESTNTMYLFGPQGYSPSSGAVYNLEVGHYDENEFIREHMFVPAIRDIDGLTGVYDTISNEFKPSSAILTHGPEVGDTVKSHWVYEYSLNNSSFTAAQWESINSGVTAENIAQILQNELEIAELQSDVDGKVSKSGDTMTGNLNLGQNSLLIESTTEGYSSKIHNDASGLNLMTSGNGSTYASALKLYNSQNKAIFRRDNIYTGSTEDEDHRLQDGADIDNKLADYLPLAGGTITGDITFYGQPNTHQYIKFFKDNAELYTFAIRNPYSGEQIDIGRVARSTGSYGELIRIDYSQNKGRLNILSGELYGGAYPTLENKFQKHSDIYKQGIVSQTQTWTGSNTAGYTYTMSNQVTGNIPIYFIDIVSRLGVIFNENTGYFELSGLTDISYNEMLDIYATTGGHISNNTWTGIYKGAYCRTNIFNWFEDTSWGNCTLSSMGRDNTFEVLNLVPLKYINEDIWVDDTIQSALNYLTLKPTSYIWGAGGSFDSFVRDSKYIRHIRGVIRLNATNTTGTNAFQNAYNLETVWLYLRNVDVNFANCPNLKLEVLEFITMKRYTGTDEQSFTIKLHPTAYNRCTLDTKQYTYSKQTYTGIIAYAAARNITIESV